MVASARLAAGLSGLRNRNARVTNKTQLRIVKGSIEADPIILDDEDDEKNRILASQGVDEEDANEHHLQAALFASSQRTSSTSHFIKTYNSTNDSNAYIPTPDAAGLVSEYDTLYPSGQYKDSATHLRFSDSIDESCIGGLSGGFTYFLDERDAEWLERNNGTARGEGTSTNGRIQGLNGINGASSILRGAPRTPHSRSAKAKGKEPEHPPDNVPHHPGVVIDEDQFELVMGLFEKWTEETVSPYLHLSSNPEHFPDFTDYERFFSTPLVPSTFAGFTLPPNVPHSELMVQLAKTIYPWWRERRKERDGHRIVPQLNVLILEAQEKEDKTGGSPYICFRKRDVKPMRKTRTNNVTHTEKLTRLRSELQSSHELARMVLQRERLKRDSAAASESVWSGRESLAESMIQLNTSIPGSVPLGDESLLFDKEHKPRKRLETTPSGRIILTNRRLSQVRAGLSETLDPHSPLALNGDTSHLFESRQRVPSERVAAIQREVERELTKTRKDDMYWEDITDMPHQPALDSVGEKFSRPAQFAASDTILNSSTSSFGSTYDAQRRARRTPRSARVRIGRGGRLHLDRRLHTAQPQRLIRHEWAVYPSHANDHPAAREDAERWALRSWRPRHDSDREVRFQRRERQLGEEYWAHPSIYDTGPEFDAIDQTSVQPQQTPMIVPEQGWKPIPFLGGEPELTNVEIAAQGTIGRDRVLEALRSRTADDISGGGGALALFMDGDVTMKDSISEEKLQDRDGVNDLCDTDARTDQAMEHAWRVEERWRYDCDGAQQALDGDDRFLLDDFQSKFLRTTVTLLDAQDHDMLATDPQSLTPPPLKQNRYLDHQLHLQHPGLPQPSVSSSLPGGLPKPLPSRQMSIPSRLVASPMLLPSGTGVHAPLSLSPAHNLAPAMNGHGNHPHPRSLPSPNPVNGMNTLGLMPNGARFPLDSITAGRGSAPMHTNHSLVNAPNPQAGVPSALSLGANGPGDAASHGPLQPHAASAYTSLKTALGRMLTSQQDPQLQGRGFQKAMSNGANGVNGDATPINHALGVNNINLKFPAQRAAQQLALPRLPANGSRPAR